MTRFLLIRHAAHDLLGRRIAGRMPGVHLSREGQFQAERLADRLAQAPIRAVYSSPLERARETAAPLARRLGLPVQVAEEVSEIDYGEWTGQSLDELAPLPLWRQFNTFRSGTRIPGGELMLESQTRIVSRLECLRARHPGEWVAIVSHGDVIKAVVAFYLGMPLDLWLRIEISPASVSIVDVNDWGPHVLTLNDTGDLLPG